MSNTCLEFTIKEKLMFSKLEFFKFKKFVNRSGFKVNSDIIEFQYFSLQLKIQRSRSKIVSGFSIILIMKRIMTF